jgi:hypothetical protein
MKVTLLDRESYILQLLGMHLEFQYYSCCSAGDLLGTVGNAIACFT